ncbi:DUF3990 domain-containing protein [Victivallis vadensis]|uniref:DUF3990 domain-containing protein n=1 Tax=Victivallis vadensis TaxID=172901 RepID=UPI0026724601|nr:DUF3990 domain-containing protein [Victivallis vadensis]
MDVAGSDHIDPNSAGTEIDSHGAGQSVDPAFAGNICRVVGPVANDRTMPVIRLFIAKVYTATETLRRLLPQKLHDQYTFKTQTALQFLKFQEVIEK